MSLLSLSKATTVYIAYDQTGRVIYVGITGQGPGRNDQHQRKSEWWPHHTRMEVEHYETRMQALLREKELIGQHRPPFNKQHNPGWERQRFEYLAAAANPYGSGPEGALNLAEALGWALPMRPAESRFFTVTFEAAPEHRVITGNWVANTQAVFNEDGEDTGNFTPGRSGVKHLVYFRDIPRVPPSCCRVRFGLVRRDPVRFLIQRIEVSFRWPAPWLEAAA